MYRVINTGQASLFLQDPNTKLNFNLEPGTSCVVHTKSKALAKLETAKLVSIVVVPAAGLEAEDVDPTDYPTTQATATVAPVAARDLAGLSTRQGQLLQYNGVPTLTPIVVSLAPAVVATATSAEQVFTVAGLQAGDVLVDVVAGGAHGANILMRGFRIVSGSAGTVALIFSATNGGTTSPYQGNYTFTVARMTGGVNLPHITVTGPGGTTSAASTTTLTGTLQNVAPNSGKMRHCGRLTDWSTNSASYAGYYGANTSTKTAGGNAGQYGPVMRFDFETDSNKFEMQVNGTGWRFQVIVDGKIVTPAPVRLPNHYKFHRVLFDFTQGGTVTPANTPRRIRIEAVNGSGTMMVGSLTLSALDSVWAPTDSPVRAIVFGDSFPEGYLLPYEFNSFANQLGYLMGWDDLWISAVGGTGYLKKVPGTSLTWRERITDLTASAPNVVVVFGSINDTIGSVYTAAQVGAEAKLFYQQLTAALPTTPIFVCGVQVMQPSRTASSALNQLAIDQNNAIKAAVQGMTNVYFIDMVAENWFTGSGTSTALTGDGNADRFLLTDGTHMTQLGHDCTARRVAASIRRLSKPT